VAPPRADGGEKKNVITMSEVARAPWARKVGQKTKSASERKAPRQPKRARDRRKMRSPVAALTRAITPRPRKRNSSVERLRS